MLHMYIDDCAVADADAAMRSDSAAFFARFESRGLGEPYSQTFLRMLTTMHVIAWLVKP
jgi:hypothetical protein